MKLKLLLSILSVFLFFFVVSPTLSYANQCISPNSDQPNNGFGYYTKGLSIRWFGISNNVWHNVGYCARWEVCQNSGSNTVKCVNNPRVACICDHPGSNRSGTNGYSCYLNGSQVKRAYCSLSAPVKDSHGVTHYVPEICIANRSYPSGVAAPNGPCGAFWAEATAYPIKKVKGASTVNDQIPWGEVISESTDQVFHDLAQQLQRIFPFK